MPTPMAHSIGLSGTRICKYYTKLTDPKEKLKVHNDEVQGDIL